MWRLYRIGLNVTVRSSNLEPSREGASLDAVPHDLQWFRHFSFAGLL
jgi:hypothetical protein